MLILLMITGLCACGNGSTGNSNSDEQIEKTIEGMSTEQKLAQMMIVALRSDSKNTKTATEISPAYAELLKKYDFGGTILFSGNLVDIDQTVTLINDCQSASIDSESGIPQFICVDQEGGLVDRVKFGVTGPGNMALAAAGDTSLTEESADMIGQELAALGINMDFAPVSDVNNNPNNPIIGTRSFSDDPKIASQHVEAFLKGLKKNNISAALKHFPGHGNVGEDSHTGLPLSELDLDELRSCELIPFESGIDAGTDMIMTAHIQFPNIEKETYKSKKDGKSVNLPATLSHEIISGVLRDELGYDGIVITDAMDMDAIAAHFDPADAATMAINAGVDILLCPVNLYQDKELNTFPEMDAYMQALLKRVESGEISEEELDDSVARILKLKYEKGIMDIGAGSAEELAAKAKETVGSADHLDRDREIAGKCLTLLKNEGSALPLDGNDGKETLILANNEYRVPTVEYVVDRLGKDGQLDGSKITVINCDELKFDDEDLQKALAKADRLVILSQSANKNELVEKAIESIRSKGGQAVFLSLALPYDAAAYVDVDAILCAYNPYGDAHDPQGGGPFNLNVAAALYSVFGQTDPEGSLPVNVPKIEFAEDGTATFTDGVLFERGTGLKNWGK